MDCEIIRNVDIPSAYVGLKVLLVDPDTTCLSNITTMLEQHSFKVTAIEQASTALFILRENIDQFDLIMVDANMLEMNYLEFIKYTQLIKDKPIVLMSPEVTMKMLKEAPSQGICFIYKKSLISSLKLRNVWKHVKWHNKKADEKSLHYNANPIHVSDNASCPTKMQDLKGKSIVNSSETHQDQDVGSLIEKDEAKRSKRIRSTDEEAQAKRSGPSEKEKDHSLLSRKSTERPEKKRRKMKWTTELDKKLDEAVRELGDKAGPKNVLKRMREPDLTVGCVTYRLKKYRSQKKQAPNDEAITSMNFNEEQHSNVVNSSNLSMDVNELIQGADIPQPPEVPLASSSDCSLNECADWINEFLQLEDF